MGLFSRSPEKKLEDELWHEMMNNLYFDRKGFISIIKDIRKNGGTCEEMQKAYDENLPIFKNKNIEFALLSSENTFNVEVVVDNLFFHVPYKTPVQMSMWEYGVADAPQHTSDSKYELIDMFDDEEAVFHKYVHYWTDISEDRNTTDSVATFNGNKRKYKKEHMISIKVYKNKNLEQVLSDFKSSSKKLKINDSDFIGYYFGRVIEKKGMVSYSPHSFIFEKDGKTVVVSVEGPNEDGYNFYNIIKRVIC
ncbi:hypothetical protein [Methanobrevibacter curvatus]|uniref:Uncharacterized protein n=1 Tax=Methanobrevibacter curvatus TaxID=49547 RepID=A0A166EE44_9EURY|nr:hypothetical protein [Methanobrevibacter curvatus]KZX16552.1 hypothetical protein MBCUR_00440 [Methanobrevibacter curvatus]